MIVYLPDNSLIQSPFLYIQAAGSTGVDGSAPGIHLRWDLLRNLGDLHIPKGDSAANNNGFNRINDDYVKIYRSEYIEQFPVYLNFETDIPIAIHDDQRLWIYKHVVTDTIIHVYFRDQVKYNFVRLGINPLFQRWQFVKNYGSELIEVSVRNKLFFASEFKLEQNGSNPDLKVETLSVKENLAPEELLVSCRKRFGPNELCFGNRGETHSIIQTDTNSETETTKDESNNSSNPDVKDKKKEINYKPYQESDTKTVSSSDCCKGPNLLTNGNFELGNTGFNSQYTYIDQSLPPASGGSNSIERYSINQNLSDPSSNLVWTAKEGQYFMIVSGRETYPQSTIEKYFWKINVNVNHQTEYCFRFWLMSIMLSSIGQSLPGKVIVRFTGNNSGNVVNNFIEPPTNLGAWEKFTFTWNSGIDTEVLIQFFWLYPEYNRNSFSIGLDDLTFCEKKVTGEESRPDESKEECKVRMVSENIRSIRYKSGESFVREIRFETYRDYIEGVNNRNGWAHLGDFALTENTPTAFERLEDLTKYPIHGRWQKFNNNAFVNIHNYKDRWSQLPGGIKKGVEEYISRSNFDPSATDTLTESSNGSETITVSYLDLLKIISMDYHVARILGLGHINTENIQSENTKYIYLAEYITFGNLDDGEGAREVKHIFVSIPTSKKDQRLPKSYPLNPVTYGLFVDNGTPNPMIITDQNGYTFDGKARFINLFVQQETDNEILGDFFVPSTEFCRLYNTEAAFLGIEYKKQGEPSWRKPEIAHDELYLDAGIPANKETSLIPYVSMYGRPNFIHKETESGIHDYTSYTINWFSRASDLHSQIVSTNATVFTKPNSLLPPSNFHIQLIQEESPLMLTTVDEQNMLNNIPSGIDNTLVRVTFDYNHLQDLAYDFGDQVELFFRQYASGIIRGSIISINDDTIDNKISIIRTGSYTYNSNGETINPTIPSNMTINNFIGGKFSVNHSQYEIVNATVSNITGEGPIFHLKKIRDAHAVSSDDIDSVGNHYITQETYRGPDAYDLNQLFMVAENINNPQNWGNVNPLTKKIQIGDSSWIQRNETILNDDGTTTVQKLRGIWKNVTITIDTTATQAGVYDILFENSYTLQHHPQFLESEPVEWYKGIVRVPAIGSPVKKVLEVIQIINIGSGTLRLKVIDSGFAQNPIVTGLNIEINFYPGYKVYLHKDNIKGFNNSSILPAAGATSKTTYMGARTIDNNTHHPNGDVYSSFIGQPHFMIAQRVIEPLQPLPPVGPIYATPPNFYDKSTYTFTVQFQQEPFAAVFYRANEEDILNILYKPVTISSIKNNLEIFGDDFVKITTFPWLTRNGYDFPIPDNDSYKIPNSNSKPFDGLNINNLNSFFPVNYEGVTESVPMQKIIRDAILEAFTPLTEQPLIFEHIDSSHPSPKKQVIKNPNGILLAHNDPLFCQAPMAKKIGNQEVLFVDYSLMGSGENSYFYMVREIGNRMKMGVASEILGPIKLVNSSPAEPPKIIKIYTQLYDAVLDLPTAVKIEIAGYSKNQKITHIQIYRTTSEVNSLTIRTMKLVKEIDLEVEGQLHSHVISLIDDFEDETLPFGETLYYSVVALRKVEYDDFYNPNAYKVNHAMSKPSTVITATIVDNINPLAPDIEFNFFSDPTIVPPEEYTNVKLLWNKTAYKAKYYLYKMSNTGNWVKIKNIFPTDDLYVNDPIEINLSETELNTNILSKIDEDGNIIYHRFKVEVENTSGLFNLEENAGVI